MNVKHLVLLAATTVALLLMGSSAEAQVVRYRAVTSYSAPSVPVMRQKVVVRGPAYPAYSVPVVANYGYAGYADYGYSPVVQAGYAPVAAYRPVVHASYYAPAPVYAPQVVVPAYRVPVAVPVAVPRRSVYRPVYLVP